LRYPPPTLVSSKTAKGSGASRWLVTVLILGLSGWTAFTVYEKLVAAREPAIAAEPKDNPKLEAFVGEALKLYEKGDLEAAEQQLHKASGIADKDERVHEGLANIAVARAEHTWWELTFGKHDKDARVKLLRRLNGEVESARETVAGSLKSVSDEARSGRLRLAERRLNSMLVVALALHGDVDHANGALTARLAAHPQKKLLSQFVAMVGKPRPETEEPDAGAEDAAVPDSKKPALAGSDPPRHRPDETHYEFNDEPTTGGLPKTKGELEIPAGKEKVVVPAPAPEPAPEPAPAPAPDLE
jgi:hypothetical protein